MAIDLSFDDFVHQCYYPFKYTALGNYDDLLCPKPTPCAPGKYSSNGLDYLGDGACMPCDAGSYASWPGATACWACASGTTSLAGSSDCFDILT